MTDPLPDIIAGHLAVVFRGINPALSAAAAGHRFVASRNPARKPPHDPAAWLRPDSGGAAADRAGGPAIDSGIPRRRRAVRTEGHVVRATLHRLSRQGGLFRAMRSARHRPGTAAGCFRRHGRVGSAQSQRARSRVQCPSTGQRLSSTVSSGGPGSAFDIAGGTRRHAYSHSMVPGGLLVMS